MNILNNSIGIHSAKFYKTNAHFIAKQNKNKTKKDEEGLI